MSPLLTLADIIAKGNIFSIGSPFDVTKLQKIVLILIDWQLSVPNVNVHSQLQCTYVCEA